MKAEIFKGVFVFFLGVFIGGYGLKISRPAGLPSEKDMLVMIKHLQGSLDALTEKVRTVGETKIAAYLDAKDAASVTSANTQTNLKTALLAEEALVALLPILNEELKIKFQSNTQKLKDQEGYKKVPVNKSETAR